MIIPAHNTQSNFNYNIGANSEKRPTTRKKLENTGTKNVQSIGCEDLDTSLEETDWLNLESSATPSIRLAFHTFSCSRAGTHRPPAPSSSSFSNSPPRDQASFLHPGTSTICTDHAGPCFHRVGCSPTGLMRNPSCGHQHAQVLRGARLRLHRQRHWLGGLVHG